MDLNEDDLATLFEQVSNWGRWGPDDQRGTLNLLTADHRRRGLRAAEEGLAVSCALPIDTLASAENLNPAQWHLLTGGDVAPRTGYGVARDFIALAPHGPAHTHLDALCHVFHDGRMYNGLDAGLVATTGATANGIGAAEHGIVARGVFLDIAALRTVDYLEASEPVRRAELIAAEERAGCQVEAGDAVLVRVGRHARREIEGPGSERVDGRLSLAGLHPECLTWLRERDIVLLGSDAAHDPLPSPFPTLRSPIHIGALVYLGLHLLDNAWLEDLRAACATRSRWTFLLSVAPLRMAYATGSPVNPIAVL